MHAGEALERMRVVLRTIWHPELGPLEHQEHDQTMQSIGKMREAAAHLKAVATDMPKPVQLSETDPILFDINETTDQAVDFR